MAQELKSSSIQPFRDRVAAIIDLLPRNYTAIVIKHYPEYNTKQGYILVQNVKKMLSTDPKITAILEKIASGKLTLDSKKS